MSAWAVGGPFACEFDYIGFWDLRISVAENYRRDPINRLARALIDDGAIGTPQLMIETGIGGGNQLFITPCLAATEFGCHHPFLNRINQVMSPKSA